MKTIFVLLFTLALTPAYSQDRHPSVVKFERQHDFGSDMILFGAATFVISAGMCHVSGQEPFSAYNVGVFTGLYIAGRIIQRDAYRKLKRVTIQPTAITVRLN